MMGYLALVLNDIYPLNPANLPCRRLIPAASFLLYTKESRCSIWRDRLEAFRVADAFSPSRNGRTMYECTVVSSRGGRVMTGDGVELATKPTGSLAKKAVDTVVVPGGFHVDGVTRDRALVQWIRNIAPGCKRVCSVCVGSFLLAEAGILDGRR